MLRHRGKGRQASHNLRLATILSLVAGVVNICGVMHVQVLTTNVTGHFAFFAEELVTGHAGTAVTFFSYIAAFLSGAFLCGLLTEAVARLNAQVSHLAPMLLECMLLLLCVYAPLSTFGLACALLFAMGIQNALVTKVSGAVVRTTHLTGMFTDLGIELSQAMLPTTQTARKMLGSSITLRLIIIVSFLAGGLLGGFLYMSEGIGALGYAAALVLIALLYDNIRYRVYYLRRKARLLRIRASGSSGV